MKTLFPALLKTFFILYHLAYVPQRGLANGPAPSPQMPPSAPSANSPAPAPKPLPPTRKMPPSKLGTWNSPIKIAMVPSTTASEATLGMKKLSQCLQTQTALFFDILVPHSYVAVVESLKANGVHGAMLNSYGYYLAQKQGARAILTVSRNRSKTYHGEIVVQANGPIKTLKDLHGKIVATVDPTSTSSLYGLDLLEKNGIKPAKVLVSNSHPAALTRVYQGPHVAHAALVYHDINNNDARARVVSQFPDVFEKLKILALTEPIINEPFVVYKDFPKDVEEKVKNGLKACAQKSPEIFRSMNDADGFFDADNSTYAEFIQKMNALSTASFAATLK